MGCDIHILVEYQQPLNDELDKCWWGFNDRAIQLDRNYRMFNLMANVRGNKDEALFQPKGLPTDMSWTCFYCCYLPVDQPSGRSVSQADAENWIARGAAHWFDPTKHPYFSSSFKPEEKWVSNPDFHTPSWLTIEEYARCIHTYIRREGTISEVHILEYCAILDLMNRFDHYNTRTSRLVFWFDN